jgi:hypothetical protein
VCCTPTVFLYPKAPVSCEQFVKGFIEIIELLTAQVVLTETRNYI